MNKPNLEDLQRELGSTTLSFVRVGEIARRVEAIFEDSE